MIRRSAVLAPAVAGATGVLSVMTVALAGLSGGDVSTFLAGNQANTWLAGLSFGVVAWLILRQSPANRLGPIFAAAGVLAGVGAVAGEYVVYAFHRDDVSMPATNTAAVLALMWLPEIAHRLVLSDKTVRNHVSNIFAKLQVDGRAQAIVKAREAGLGTGVV